MNAPDAELIDAKIEAAEARMDSRIGVVEALLHEVIALLDRMEARLDRRMDAMEQRISGLKTTIIVTGISSTVAVILGVGAINATVYTSLLGAYTGGKELEQSRADIRRQSAEIDQQLAQSKAEFERQSAEIDKQLAKNAAAIDDIQRRLKAQRPPVSQAPSR